jgi:hypothetical protein
VVDEQLRAAVEQVRQGLETLIGVEAIILPHLHPRQLAPHAHQLIAAAGVLFLELEQLLARLGGRPPRRRPPRDLLPLDGAGCTRGRRPRDDPYRRFRSEVERAIADAEAAEVTLIVKAARDGDWRAAGWLLERRFSDRWGRRDRLEQVHEIKPTDEATDLDREIERLLEEEIARREQESAFEDEH